MPLIDFFLRLLGFEPSSQARQFPDYPTAEDDGEQGWASDEDLHGREATSSVEKPQQLAGLDTDKFAPLTTKEALGETQSANWKSAYFDSVTVIPPADLPRIRVIDGTMVGLGLISSEELAEIHRNWPRDVPVQRSGCLH